MKRFLFLTVLMIASMQLFGANVDLATARATAQQYAASKMAANGKIMAPAAIDLQLVKQEMNTDKPGTAVYYIFNTDDHFIIISGDDRARTVLAYGDRPIKDINSIAGSSRDCCRSDAQCRRHQGRQRRATAHRHVGPAGALLQPLPGI